MVEIIWHGHASLVFIGTKTIYVDPWKLNSKKQAPADLILITHEHYDHFSVEDIKKIVKQGTDIFITPDMQSKLRDVRDLNANIHLVEPNKKYSAQGITIETIPAYNTNKQFHPHDNDWVGYIFTLDGKRIYQAGDSDVTLEMKALKNIDIAVVPVSGTYVMTAKEAAFAVNTFKPKLAIPMHWGDIVGTKADAEEFKRLAECEVRILEKQ